MRSGTKMGPVPIGKITKRLPIGGHKRSGIGGVVDKLPANVPGGKALGTAGGLLLGAGAAAAAGRALSRRNSGQDDEPEQNGTEQNSSKSTKSAQSTDTAEDSGGGKGGGEESGKPAEKAKGLFGKLKDSVGGLLKKGGGKGGGGKKVKVTSIIEHTDIGAPRRLVYDQFTQFQEFPSFMKKVISVDQADDEKLNWQAKIFWSKRTWEATIVEQIPDEHIVWRSKGAKGHVDGTISFHELAPNLTRVLVVLEYHPQGLFERTGNIWRAQGRRVRLELKHFRRHVMTQTLTHPDDVEGWRGEIRDSEVVKTHEDALKEEEKSGEGPKAAKRDDSGSKGSRGAKNNAKEKEKEYEKASR